VGAAVVGPYTGELLKLFTHAQFGGGDVFFTITAQPSSCPDGFWIKASDPGAKGALAQLLAAYHAKASVTIYAYNDQMWPGSSGQVCLVQAVGYQP
jgi:hypothetical protein